MKKEQSIKLEYCFEASTEQVFAFFSEHSNLGKIWPAKVTRTRAGFNPKQPNGIGSVRRIQLGLTHIEETITDFIPNQRIEYTISKRSPFKDYRGIMEFHRINDSECLYRHRFIITHWLPAPVWLSEIFIKLGIARGMPKAQTFLQTPSTHTVKD